MPPCAIVLSLDQLSRHCLGCYGHEWIETPNLDRLAARAVVFDQCFASPSPESALRDAALSGCDRLREAGIRVQWLREPPPLESGDWHQTPFARLVAEAENVLVEFNRETMAPWLLWLESAGVDWPDRKSVV